MRVEVEKNLNFVVIILINEYHCKFLRYNEEKKELTEITDDDLKIG